MEPNLLPQGLDVRRWHLHGDEDVGYNAEALDLVVALVGRSNEEREVNEVSRPARSASPLFL